MGQPRCPSPMRYKLFGLPMCPTPLLYPCSANLYCGNDVSQNVHIDDRIAFLSLWVPRVILGKTWVWGRLWVTATDWCRKWCFGSRWWECKLTSRIQTNKLHLIQIRHFLLQWTFVLGPRLAHTEMCTDFGFYFPCSMKALDHHKLVESLDYTRRRNSCQKVVFGSANISCNWNQSPQIPVNTHPTHTPTHKKTTTWIWQKCGKICNLSCNDLT